MKKILVDKSAEKEFRKLTEKVRSKIDSRVKILARDGSLKEPYGKKLNDELFEIRINVAGQWRVLYAYLIKDSVVLLTVFLKKCQKTPVKEINKALKRLKKYL